MATPCHKNEASALRRPIHALRPRVQTSGSACTAGLSALLIVRFDGTFALSLSELCPNMNK